MKKSFQSKGGHARAKALSAVERRVISSNAARARWKAVKRFSGVDDLIFHTTGPTFQLYWREMQRHRAALRKIYAGDKLHHCEAVEMGTLSRVHPGKRCLIVTFTECALCGRDMTQETINGKKK